MLNECNLNCNITYAARVKGVISEREIVRSERFFTGLISVIKNTAFESKPIPERSQLVQSRNSRLILPAKSSVYIFNGTDNSWLCV